MILRPLLVLSLVSAFGCTSEGEVVDPVWANEVAPIVENSCLPCHRTGGSLSLTLDSRDSFVRYGSMVLAALESERMPPGSIDRSGACGDYRGYQPVTAEDVDTIARFLDSAPPTTGEELRAVSPVADPQGEPAALLLPRYTPTPGGDDHRCFVLARPPESGTVITGLGVERAEGSSLHHLMIFSLPSQAAAQQARAMEAQDAEVGYACEGHPRVTGSELLSVWTPGQGTISFPPGTGVSSRGPQLLVQAHYHLDDHQPSQPEDLTLVLHTSDDVPTIMRPVPFAASGFALVPGESQVEHSSSRLAPFAEKVVVHGVFPHMHTLGKSLSIEVESEAETECLARSTRWQFDWQDTAFFETPKVLEARTRLNLSCVWNTQDRLEFTRWGEGSLDEMCTIFLFVSR